MVFSRVVIAAVLLGGCPKSDSPPPAPLEPPVVADASIDGITTISDFDPNSGMHLDDNPTGRAPPKRVKGPSVPIGIMLKSTPNGATVIVDGENLGETPKYWAGAADGNEHEFEFSKKGYALARYVFVPITSGTLYATLEHVSADAPSDAGLDTSSRFTRDAAVAPPPTILTPVDARAVAPLDATEAATDAGDMMPPEEPPAGSLARPPSDAAAKPPAGSATKPPSDAAAKPVVGSGAKPTGSAPTGPSP